MNKIGTRLVLTFDGEDDYIDFGKRDINGVFGEGSTAFTVSGWINPYQLTNKASTYGTRNVFLARSSDRYSDNFEFGISESGNLDVYIDEKVDNTIKTLGNGELTVREWHFFAVIFNQGQLTIHLDDHEYAGSLSGSSLNKASSPVTLGATLHNNIYFTGQLANISIWNYPCSHADIQTQRNQALVGNEAGLVAYWTLDEGEGKTVRDLTGNAHNGKLRGNPIWNLIELPFMTTQSSANGESQDKTINNLEDSPSTTETTTLQESLPNQTIIAQTHVVAINEIQPEREKKTDEQSANTKESLDFQSKAEEMPVDQTSQSETRLNTQLPELSEVLTDEECQKPMNTAATAKYKILAIDGGGIRAIIPALILAEIEKRTQKQIFSLFDLIAGTSSGGILALGLTKPRLNSTADGEPVAEYSAKELVKLFVEYGPEIFYESFFQRILSPIDDIFIQPKYSFGGREDVLKQYFGDALLENNLKEVFVTSYDIEQRIPILLTNKLEKQNTESRSFRKLCRGFTLTDAALATSATPTYFAPHHLSTAHNASCLYTLVDGGLVANNPTNLAILEAQVNRQEAMQVLSTNDILVVSLGTGSLTSGYAYDEVEKWGLLQWTAPLLNMIFDGNSEIIAGQVEQLFYTGEKVNKSYYRFQPFLTGEMEAIDNVKSDNICKLQAVAKQLIAEKSQEIDELCNLLLNTLL